MNQHPVLAQWFQAVAELDRDKVIALLAPDVEVAPPFLDSAVSGRAEVIAVFSAFEQVTDKMEYGRYWQNGDELVLEFFTAINGEEIHGVDVIKVNAEGQIERFDIMARPQSRVQKMGAAIKQHLANASKWQVS